LEVSDGPWSVHPTYAQILNVLDALNAGLLVRSVEGRIHFANGRALHWVGYEPKELDGMDVRELVPDELRPSFEDDLHEIHSGDERLRITIMKRKDGRTLPVVSCPHLLRDDEGVILAVVTVLLDLGEVQTARRVDGRPASGLSAGLERIAHELRTLSLFAGSAGIGRLAPDHPDVALLSAREREILSELVTGLRVPAIAKKLFISPHTVRNHLKSMYRKLEVPDQASLIERIRSYNS
jgi:PAS domain S-box-containing protein